MTNDNDTTNLISAAHRWAKKPAPVPQHQPEAFPKEDRLEGNVHKFPSVIGSLAASEASHFPSRSLTMPRDASRELAAWNSTMERPEPLFLTAAEVSFLREGLGLLTQTSVLSTPGKLDATWEHDNPSMPALNDRTRPKAATMYADAMSELLQRISVIADSGCKVMIAPCSSTRKQLEESSGGAA